MMLGALLCALSVQCEQSLRHYLCIRNVLCYVSHKTFLLKTNVSLMRKRLDVSISWYCIRYNNTLSRRAAWNGGEKRTCANDVIIISLMRRSIFNVSWWHNANATFASLHRNKKENHWKLECFKWQDEMKGRDKKMPNFFIVVSYVPSSLCYSCPLYNASMQTACLTLVSLS